MTEPVDDIVPRSPLRFRTAERSNPAYERDGIMTVTVKSPALRRRADVTVALPEGAAEAEDPLPAAVLLHGVFASHWAWTGLGGAHLTLRRLVQSGEIRPMALVMPSDGLFGDGSGYVRLPDEDAESWIVDEVVPAARLLHGPIGAAGVCIGGFSMGGFGALRLAARHPDAFVAVAGMSSITDLAQMRHFVEEDVETTYPVPEDERSVADLMIAAADHLPPVHLDCGLDDPLLRANRRLHAALDDAGIRHHYEELDGGHSWDYWSAHLDRVLRFFDRHLHRDPAAGDPP